MNKSDYWLNFWKTNQIVHKNNPHEKVGRTISGVPIAEELWNKTLDFVSEKMELSDTDRVLDIGAGSGMITVPFADKVKHITAVDISEELLRTFAANEKIEKITADIREIGFMPKKFTKVIFYFSIQHFSEGDIVSLFSSIYKWLDDGGICYIGDVPDADKMFRFFNNKERRRDYFNSLLSEKPILGTWFHRDFFIQLGKYTGFRDVEIVEQPSGFINAHYRFDVILRKPQPADGGTISYKVDDLDPAELEGFLNASDKLFAPPMSTVVDLKTYSKKLYDNSRIFTATLDGTVIGLLACYANSFQNKSAYIPYICVLKKYQSAGIATQLYDQCEAEIKRLGFEQVSLEVYLENSNVIRFYENIGFGLSKKVNDYKILLSKELK